MKILEIKRTLWKDRVSEYKSSGLTMRKWCEENELKLHQLQYWVRKFKNEDHQGVKWLPVHVPVKSESEDNQTIIINVGHYAVELNDDFKESH